MGWIDDKFKDIFKTGKELIPYAAAAAPFVNYYGLPALLGKYEMGKNVMDGFTALNKSKLMNSAIGTAGKDALMKYALSAASGAKNPELVGRRAFWSSLPYSWLKTGGDWQQMLGNVPEVDISDFTEDITFDVPAEMGTRITPQYTDYGQSMMDKYYGPGRGGVDINPYYGEFMDGSDYGQAFTPLMETKDGLTGGWSKYNKIMGSMEPMELAERMKPITYEISPSETITKNVIRGGDLVDGVPEGFAAISEAGENPLAGLDYVMRKKTKPSVLDTLMKKEAPLGVEPGSDAYNEFFGIGETEIDPYYIGKSIFDFMAGGPTEGDLAEDEEEGYKEMLARMAITPYGSLEGFLGNKGGIASLNKGGQPGPYTDPIASDDFDVNVQEIIQGPGYESIDELGALFGEEEMAMSEPHPMAGWYDMYTDKINSGEFEGTFDEFMEMIRDSDFTPSVAQGGKIGMYGGGELNGIPGGTISGPGTETSDSIPAQLSNNEFVFTADAVRAAGGGNVDAGAHKLYGIMNALDPDSAKPGDPPQYA